MVRRRPTKHPQAMSAIQPIQHFHTTEQANDDERQVVLHCWCGAWLLLDYFTVPHMRALLDHFLDGHNQCQPKKEGRSQ
jgi:hypothetical protein